MKRYWVPLACLLLFVTSQPSWAGIYLSISDTGAFTLSNRPSEDRYVLITGPQTREELNKTDRAVEIASGKHGLPRSLIFSVMRNLDRPEGGPMGLPESVRATMPDTAVNDISKNIMAGAKHISELLVEFEGNLMLTLGAYYTSEQAVKENDGLPSNKARNWVREVRRSFSEFESRDEIIYTYKSKDGVVNVVNIQP